MGAVAYLTDVEGIWVKLEDFARGNPLVALEGERLMLADEATLVFGGDAIDRGAASRRVVSALLDARRRYGERVVLLAGNRDINKLRLSRELAGHPPARAPREVVLGGRAALLKWIFENTMGARLAFEMRRAELSNGGAAVGDDDVVESFVADVAPGGALASYLAECRLAYRHGRTLFVHGAVTEASLGAVPGNGARLGDPLEWIEALNAFYDGQIAAYHEGRIEPGGEPAWAPLVAYQAPVPGTRLHQASVVYGRPADELGNPVLPPRAVVEALARAGVERVVVGHTPSGDSPSVLRDDGFELVIADNSYGRTERGAQVLVDDDRLSVSGTVVLDGREARDDVRVELDRRSSSGPIGLRDAPTGRLVKGRLASGKYLSFRFLGGFALEQTALSEEACAALSLVVPRGA